MRLLSRFRPSPRTPVATATLAGTVLLLGIMISPVDAAGQSTDIAGVAYVTDWPESRQPPVSGQVAPPLNVRSFNLLPFIDTLAVQYRFSRGEVLPSVHFSIDWTVGDRGILNGRSVSIDQLPSDVVIESIDLLLPVIVRNEVVAEFFLPLDTIHLGPAPSITFIDIANVAWDSLFVNVDDPTARAIFATGFQLGAPRILRIVFTVDRSRSEATSARDRRYPPTAPPERTVCIPDLDIWISWSGGRSRWVPPPGTISKAERDRRGEIGRAGLVDRTRMRRGFDRDRSDEPRTSGADDAPPETTDGGSASGEQDTSGESRSERTKRKTGGAGGIGDLVKPSDDDDDDDDRLYPAALAGVAAVGGVAIFGGTIGYFGSMSKAPIGLMSGYVEPTGGFLLQVAINRQVFGEARGPENLIASVTAFHAVFNSPIQPAVGLGVRFTEEGTATVSHKPSVSLGLVGNFGPIVALAGYDVVTPDFRFGIAVNIRHLMAR